MLDYVCHIGQDRMAKLAEGSLLGSLTKVHLPLCELTLSEKPTKKTF